MKLNPHISVDCVVFGFDYSELKVLLVERESFGASNQPPSQLDFKLPGDLIGDEEDLNNAANRILKEITGLEHIYLKQFSVFGNPQRIQKERDLEWLRQTSGLPVERVVSIAYYALVKIENMKLMPGAGYKGSWQNIQDIRQLAFDHMDIMNKALKTLRKEILAKPLAFELLPENFTKRQLQTVYEVILGQTLDNRNFRKKIANKDYISPVHKKEDGVAHKPAELYLFDENKFKRNERKMEL